MSLAMFIHTASSQSHHERKQSCLWKRGNQVCVLTAWVVENDHGEPLGTMCPMGHVISVMKRARKKCPGCGSRLKGRHDQGCYVAAELIERAIERATDWQLDAECAEDWESIQEEIEEVFQFADQRLGGPL